MSQYNEHLMIYRSGLSKQRIYLILTMLKSRIQYSFFNQYFTRFDCII